VFEQCEKVRIDEETLFWVFGRRKLAFLGATQYKSLKYGESLNVRMDELDKTAASPSHEFGSYILGMRGRLKRRKQILEKLEKWKVQGVEELLSEKEVGPWEDLEGRHYKFEEHMKGGRWERWSVRLPYKRKGSFEPMVEIPNIGEPISLKRSDKILKCIVIDLVKRRTATASILLEQCTTSNTL
jgi:hypothetical protein